MSYAIRVGFTWNRARSNSLESIQVIGKLHFFEFLQVHASILLWTTIPEMLTLDGFEVLSGQYLPNVAFKPTDTRLSINTRLIAEN